jgi:hypothetical protein
MSEQITLQEAINKKLDAKMKGTHLQEVRGGYIILNDKNETMTDLILNLEPLAEDLGVLPKRKRGAA